MRYIQLAMEASIPLLGFFLWDWSLYFILLFYFIDLIAAELIMHLKSKKIVQYLQAQQSKKDWVIRSTFSFTVLLLGGALIHFSMLFIQDGIDFSMEIAAFWNYEEMGLKQGYIFVPLVFLLSYQQYKMEFLLPARYRTLQVVDVWKKHTKALIVVAGFSGICLGVSLVYVLPEIVFVFGIVTFTVLYKLKFDN